MERIIILFILMSCSSTPFKSGKYVLLQGDDTFETLAKEFEVPIFMIKKANEGRNFEPGTWYYIPQMRGVIGTLGSVGLVKALASGDLQWPVPVTRNISSEYGGRWGKEHKGIDIPAPVGSPILAVDDGEVVYAGNELSGFGNLTVIAHNYGVFSVYGHANKLLTQKGDKVKRGQIIAEVGNTGVSTGPHLHLEVRWQGQPMDPETFFK
ncbi:MAG: M23 family metallopeptidase [Bacteriovoracales bacterium]